MNLLAEFNGKISDCIMYLRHEFSMQAVNSKFKFHASSDQVVRYLVGCFCAIIAYFMAGLLTAFWSFTVCLA